MKKAVIMLAIVAVICTLDVVVSNFIAGSTEKMMPFIQKIKEALDAGDLETASGQIAEMKRQWDGCEHYWEAYVDHRESENVKTLLTRLEAMGKAGTPELMLPELEELEFYFEHLNDKQKLLLENIF